MQEMWRRKRRWLRLREAKGRREWWAQERERKAKLAEEERRLSELKSVIEDFIRKADGSEQTRKDISAMTVAMQNALKLVAHARDLSVKDFFNDCPFKTCRI